MTPSRTTITIPKHPSLLIAKCNRETWKVRKAGVLFSRFLSFFLSRSPFAVWMLKQIQHDRRLPVWMLKQVQHDAVAVWMLKQVQHDAVPVWMLKQVQHDAVARLDAETSSA